VGKLAPEKLKHLDFNDARDDRVAVESSRPPYAIIYISIQTDNHATTSSLNFYRLDVLPDAQPTVSKHSRLMLLL